MDNKMGYCSKIGQFQARKYLLGNIVIMAIALCTSCTTVKNYPINKPFVYDNQIIIKGQITNKEKQQMVFNLASYWQDSLIVRKVQQFGVFYVIRKPAVFDSSYLLTTEQFMNSYLNSQGYYNNSLRPSVSYADHKDKKKKIQKRVFLAMNIQLGKRITMDSVGFQLGDSNLQRLTDSLSKKSFLKTGGPYSKQIISNELDRLVRTYHQNGYFKIQREDLYASVDTLDDRILQLTFNLFEQARMIGLAKKIRHDYAKWDVTIMQRPIKDSSKQIRYSVGKLYFYPEYSGFQNLDTIIRSQYLDSVKFRDMVMRYTQGKFSYKPFLEHSFLRRGDIYNEDRMFKTVNNLSRMGAWSSVDYTLKTRDKDTVDLHFFLQPNPKQSYNLSLEGSRNTGDIGTGNLLGVAASLAYTNRNVGKQSVQSQFNIRQGLEFNIDNQSGNSGLLQTFQLSGGLNYSFPRLIVPFRDRYTAGNLDSKKSILSFSGSYTDRKTYYVLHNYVTNWGYDWSKNNNNWQFKPFNLELYKVDTLAGLDTLFSQNPFLRNSFRNGNVFGTIVGWSRTFNSKIHPNVSHLLRFGAEESGFLLTSIHNLDKDVYSYIKIENEYRFSKKYLNNEVAARAFVGIGIAKNGQNLPVFKQYFLGGPNSMRAWGLRQLGLGSSKLQDTSKSGYSDRYGDFTIETNAEYRFQMALIGALKVMGAFFTDIGNVWDLRNESGDPKTVISLKDLEKDIAIGIGTGVRFDFSYFLLRFDFAYKMKDPARDANGGWWELSKLAWTDTRANGVNVKNFAIQFGIGLPF